MAQRDVICVFEDTLYALACRMSTRYDDSWDSRVLIPRGNQDASSVWGQLRERVVDESPVERLKRICTVHNSSTIERNQLRRDAYICRVRTDGNLQYNITATLTPYFKKYVTKKSGLDRGVVETTWSIPNDSNQSLKMSCGGPDKRPRFAIWIVGKPLTINATSAYYCESEVDLPSAINAALAWCQKFNNFSPGHGATIATRTNITVVVFDLDQTLIPDKCYKDEDDGDRGEDDDDDQSTKTQRLDRAVDIAFSGLDPHQVNDPLKRATHVLETARMLFDCVVLWSHGNSLHVQTQLNRLNFKFDIVLFAPPSNLSSSKESTSGCDSESLKRTGYAKNLLHLYNLLPKNLNIARALLVEDSVYNWTPEYDALVLVERGVTNVEKVCDALHRFARAVFAENAFAITNH